MTTREQARLYRDRSRSGENSRDRTLPVRVYRDIELQRLAARLFLGLAANGESWGYC